MGFTIIDKVSVNGSPQYKVKNSRGNAFYITASSYYVSVK
ncbi:n-acetylmuramoyl-L-alanine amidase family 2 [Bacillus mycoides]|nr:n-acetylmuramoyl-L-alanine amidase family 2 [Bacillus mycoides]EEL04246.1 N-acetylmuramoyl-L-alanine amidase family 2 [Bacillus cereus BDRD-ST196]